MLLTPRYLFQTGPQELTPLLRSYPDTPLLLRIFLGLGIGSQFSPVNFQNLPPRLVRYYALLRGWLLLSLPPSCLRREIPSLHLTGI